MNNRQISVHLILDSHSVYNSDYHEQKLRLGGKYGNKLVIEFDRKLECTKLRKPYQPESFVDDIIQEVAHGIPAVQLNDDVMLRMQQRTQALSAIRYSGSASYASALSILAEYSEDMDNGLANFVTRLPTSLQQELFLQSNQALLQHILNDAANGSTVFIANGTHRQFYNFNLFESLVLDTSCLFSDIQALVSRVRSRTKQPEFIHLDALTMYDALYDLPNGDHHKSVLGSISQSTHHTNCQHIDFISIYLHAHFHACHHGEKPVDLHCYVSTDDALQTLKAWIIQFHEHLPQNVQIILQKYNGKLLERTACIGSAIEGNINFRHFANRMIGGISNRTFTAIEKPKDSYYVAMLDADNCIYNIYYYQLLTLLVAEFGDYIVNTKLRKMKYANTEDLAKEMLKFVKKYPKNKLVAKEVNYQSMHKKRSVLVNKFNSLVLDSDIVKSRQMMIAEDSKIYDRNEHGPIFCQLVRMINTISPDIITCILFRSNERLFTDMKVDAKEAGVTKIIFLVASLRQSYLQDLKNSAWNGSGMFHKDLPRLVRYLNDISKDNGAMFVFDPATLADYSCQLAPGCHIGLSDQPDHQFMQITCDNDKRLITYKAAHHIRRKYQVDTIDFFDDSIRVFSGILSAYRKDDSHGLLPSGLRINLIGYNGRYMRIEKSVTGRGIVDHHPHRFLGYVCNTQHGVNSIYSGQFAGLSQLREKITHSQISQFIELTRWQHPKAFFAPGREKTIRKINRTIDILSEEIDRFCTSSQHVKHGIYAGQLSLPARELTTTLQDIKNGSLKIDVGLDKILLLSRNHGPIHHAANKLKNLMYGTKEEEWVKFKVLCNNL